MRTKLVPRLLLKFLLFLPFHHGFCVLSIEEPVLNFKCSTVEHKNVVLEFEEFALGANKILPNLDLRPCLFLPSFQCFAITSILFLYGDSFKVVCVFSRDLFTLVS